MRMSTTVRVLRWQRVNPMNRVGATTDLPGSLFLSNDANATRTVVPMHLFCLDHTINRNLPGAGATQGVAYAVQFDDLGAVSFSALGASFPLAERQWSIERADDISAQNLNKRFIACEWKAIKFLCYGAQNQPTTYDIQIVRFKRDYLDPLENPSSSREADDRRALYQSMVQPLMTNPVLMNYQAKVRPGVHYTVIKRIRFTLQPTLTTERDVTPKSRPVTIFYRDGRVLDYQYTAEGFGGVTSDDKLNTTEFVTAPNQTADYSEAPAAPARTWLIVRAMNTTPTNGADQTALNTPSYDIVLRKLERLTT